MVPERPAVLVVDDEPSVRHVLCLLLRDAGIEAASAADGAAAAGMLRAEPGRFPVVILDLSIPGQSGRATFDALRHAAPGVRVLLASGYERDDALRDFEGADLAGFLAKPFDEPELLDAVRRELRRPT